MHETILGPAKNSSNDRGKGTPDVRVLATSVRCTKEYETVRGFVDWLISIVNPPEDHSLASLASRVEGRRLGQEKDGK